MASRCEWADRAVLTATPMPGLSHRVYESDTGDPQVRAFTLLVARGPRKTPFSHLAAQSRVIGMSRVSIKPPCPDFGRIPDRGVVPCSRFAAQAGFTSRVRHRGDELFPAPMACRTPGAQLGKPSPEWDMPSGELALSGAEWGWDVRAPRLEAYEVQGPVRTTRWAPPLAREGAHSIPDTGIDSGSRYSDAGWGSRWSRPLELARPLLCDEKTYRHVALRESRPCSGR